MVFRVFGEVILADAVVIMNFEHDQVVGLYRGGVAQRQGVGHNWFFGDAAPEIDDRDPSVQQNFIDGARIQQGFSVWQNRAQRIV